MSKKKLGKKNNHAQEVYKKSIKLSMEGRDGTVPLDNDMLKGSDDIYSFKDSELHTKVGVRPKSIKYKLFDWLKRNVLAAIIIAAITGAAGAVITHSIQIAVINQRIDYLEEEVESLKDTTVSKSDLKYELLVFKNNVKDGSDISIDTINKKLTDIEKRIEALK